MLSCGKGSRAKVHAMSSGSALSFGGAVAAFGAAIAAHTSFDPTGGVIPSGMLLGAGIGLTGLGVAFTAIE